MQQQAIPRGCEANYLEVISIGRVSDDDYTSNYNIPAACYEGFLSATEMG